MMMMEMGISMEMGIPMGIAFELLIGMGMRITLWQSKWHICKKSCFA